MLGLQTELKLAHLLKTIADAEKQVEIVRQVLAEQLDFEPYTAFKRIDTLGLGYLRVADLHDFLRDNNIVATERNVLHLFQLYGTNGDQRLTYSNFLNATLPVTSPALRQLATQRESYYVARDETLPYDVEWALARVFDKEINAHLKIELLKEDLINRYDFDTLNAFKTVDADRLGSLDHETLYQFFRSNKITVSDDDVLALLRRLDKDQDGKVSYAEFVDSVMPADPYYKVARAERSPTRTQRSPSRARSIQGSPARSTRRTQDHISYSTTKGRNLSNLDYYEYLNRSQSRSPKRSGSLSRSYVADDSRPSPVRESISKKLSFERDNDRLSRSQTSWSPRRSQAARSPRRTQQASPSRSRIEEDRYRTPTRGRSPIASPTRERASPLKGNEEDHLAKALKEQIQLDKELEGLRNDLSLKSDFNLLDCFKVFDLYGRGYITSGEFEDGLKEFGVYPSRDELYLIFRKFDKDSDGLLR